MKLIKNTAPIYIKDGIEEAVTASIFESGENGEHAYYNDGTISLDRRVVTVSEGFYKVSDKYKNVSGETGDFEFILEIEQNYVPDFTLVPCVSYDGNKFGNRGDPKGLERDGSPWVFGYSRTGLPSCTITEGEADEGRLCCGLFASSDTKASLVSGGSVFKAADGRVRQRIYRPEVEAPLTYSCRDGYGDARRDTVKLAPGETFECCSYVVICRPDYPRFGVEKVYAAVASVLDLSSQPAYTDDELWDLGISYASNCLVDAKNGYTLFSIGLTPDENGNFVQRGGGRYEIGWCGQNGTFALAMISDYLRNKNEESLKLGVAVLDTWIKLGTLPNGFFTARLPDDILDYPDKRVKTSDSVNNGYGTMQLLKAAEALEKAGIDKPEVERCALALCDLMLTLFTPDKGMPSVISNEGEAVSYDGAGGMFMGYAFTAAYKRTGDAKYLDGAKRLLDYYTNRDLNLFACAAGALDTSCVDKETCCPFLYTALDLYEITGEKHWLDIAGRAAAYLVTWSFMFDVVYPDDSDFTKMGYRTKGGTVVSAQHAHIDPWGALISADIERYARVSGKAVYHTFAKMMWDNATLCISDGKTPDCRGKVRPRGSQSEAYMHTHWYFARPSENFAGGFINDWLVAWPSAHRLAALMRNRGFR